METEKPSKTLWVVIIFILPFCEYSNKKIALQISKERMLKTDCFQLIEHMADICDIYFSRAIQNTSLELRREVEATENQVAMQRNGK